LPRPRLTAPLLPRLGHNRLAALTAPRISNFRDELLQTLSRVLARKVLTVLKAVLKDAVRRGTVAQNVAAGVSITSSSRDRRKLEVGRDIPAPNEIQKIIHARSEEHTSELQSLTN